MKQWRRVIQLVSCMFLMVFWFPIEWFVLLAIFLGPVYCGWICPMGFLQDISIGLRKLLKIRVNIVNDSMYRLLKYFRYLLWMLVMAGSITWLFSILAYDPRANIELFYTRGQMTQVLLFGLGITFILGIFEPRVFCKYFCIEGAKIGLFGTIRLVKITRNESTCVRCRKCNYACSQKIDVMNTQKVQSHQCIQCLDCIDACPVDGTLKLKVLNDK